jgi:predicted acyltransferase
VLPFFALNRSIALDFYRGLTIALMIVVNTPGTWDAVYPPLQHAAWHGCTPTDLVFPSFMFLIGVSMWFAFERYGRQWSAALGWKILRRTALIFLLGLLVNKFPFYWKDWGDWRIMGVLQRLALGYGLASVLVLHLSRRNLMWVSAGILLLYWGLLYWFGTPGADPYAMQSNAVFLLDRWLLGENHLWHGEGTAFDPEGILSTLPAIVTVVLGWLSGEMMTWRMGQKEVLARDLLTFGLICGFIGLGWDLFFPINKKLWTSSYVLYAGGISMIVLAICIWLLDIRGWRNGVGFFVAFGANPLFAYLLSEVLAIGLFSIPCQVNGQSSSVFEWLYVTVFKPLDGKEFGSLLFAVTFMFVCWAVCRWLYERKIFIKI